MFCAEVCCCVGGAVAVVTTIAVPGAVVVVMGRAGLIWLDIVVMIGSLVGPTVVTGLGGCGAGTTFGLGLGLGFSGFLFSGMRSSLG